MGLDVYLYTAAEREQNERHDREWNDRFERKERGEITQAEYDAEAVTEYAMQADVASAAHPSHLFNRRYLRSSYNGSGFNHAVPDLLGGKGDLYWIFEPLNGDNEQPDAGLLTAEDVPALTECRKRAEDVAARLRGSDRLRILTVSANQLSREWLQFDADAALRLYREAAAKHAEDAEESWWSNRDMEWFGGGMTILGAVAGVEKQFFSDQPWPAVHLIRRLEDEAFESYIASAEITAEFCDEAISLIERDGSCYMSWSG